MKEEDLIDLPDTELDWYDFGGGWNVAPIPEDAPDGPFMAALCCIRNGRYWYRTFYGDFTEENLAEMKEKYLSETLSQLEALNAE